jgi:hypothetical protein
VEFKAGAPASRRAPAVRASWAHMKLRYEDAQLEKRLKAHILRIAGFQDEVVFGMLSRHLARCAAAEAVETEEITWLLSVLLGAEPAARLAVALVDLLEEGLEVSWYDKQVRKRYGGTTD